VDSARRAVMETAELEWGAAASEFAYESENHRPICQRVICQRYLALSLLVDGQGLQVDEIDFAWQTIGRCRGTSVLPSQLDLRAAAPPASEPGARDEHRTRLERCWCWLGVGYDEAQLQCRNCGGGGRWSWRGGSWCCFWHADAVIRCAAGSFLRQRLFRCAGTNTPTGFPDRVEWWCESPTPWILRCAA
jgi:hypothetical protein